MKKINLILTIAFLFLGIVKGYAQPLHLVTPNNSLLLSASEGSELKLLYYGNRLADVDVSNVSDATQASYVAYPVYGLNCPSESALAVVHADGNMTLQMVVDKVSMTEDSDAVITKIALKDKVYPFYVNICYKAYKKVDIIESWTEISHDEKKNVTLNRFASAYLPIRRGDVWLSHLYGSWANEGNLMQEPLKAGVKTIKNKDGVRNSHTAHAEVMFSLDGKPMENSGNTIGAALCYSGNYKLSIDTDDSEYHHFYAGINEDNSEYHLKKGEIFVTPALALTYSSEGLSGCSRNFHRWGRNYKLAHGNVPRKILLNSWEGVYFDINETGMNQMMEDIASMGGELFVMDDGWFGDKYKRNSDNSSLGDWVVDTQKLPGGISKLVSDAKNHGIRFGIWIEPEMANTTSELFEKHPEWFSEIDGERKRNTQLCLTNEALVDEAEKILTSKCNLEEFGRLLDYTWKLKRGISAGISTDSIERCPNIRGSSCEVEKVNSGLMFSFFRARAKASFCVLSDTLQPITL